MTNYKELIKNVEQAGNEIFWLGPASEFEISKLETELGKELPGSFKLFLAEYGGGGVIDSEISGIEDGNACNTNGGTVLGDTMSARSNYALPKHLIVIFYKDDEICWCLDAEKLNNENECPVVSYDLFKKKVTNKIASTFNDFFKQYLELRADV